MGGRRDPSTEIKRVSVRQDEFEQLNQNRSHRKDW